MKALKSNFYLIRVNNTPVYVGYTNRPIKTRFREHLRDKDFGDGEVTQESLGSMSFDFTWDINLINQYAKEVSDRETELIAEYGTGDSVWQKGTSGRAGGQTWSDIKHFVMTNKNNPKFKNMSEEVILELVEYQHKMIKHLKNVINHTKPLEDTRLKHVINHTNPLEDTRLKNVISNTNPLEDTRLKSVINSTKPLEDTRLKHVISNTKPLEDTRLKNVINHTKPLEDIRLKNVITSTKPLEDTRLKSVISNTKPLEDRRLKSVITSTKPLEEIRLNNVITGTKVIDTKTAP